MSKDKDGDREMGKDSDGDREKDILSSSSFPHREPRSGSNSAGMGTGQGMALIEIDVSVISLVVSKSACLSVRRAVSLSVVLKLSYNLI